MPGARIADRFTLFAENEILGTGGALDGARDFLARRDHFLLHNGDVLCDADLAALVADHLRTGALATLLLVDWPAVNSVAVDPDRSGPQYRRASGKSTLPPVTRSLTYAGIGVFSREVAGRHRARVFLPDRSLGAGPGSGSRQCARLCSGGSQLE